MIHQMANLTLKAMIHLSKNEFTIAEKQRKFGKLVIIIKSINALINHLIFFSNGRIGITVFLRYMVLI